MDAYHIGLIVGSLVCGLVFGIVILVFAIKKKKAAIGVIGLIVCLIGGYYAGMLACVPATIIFMLIIKALSKKDEENEAVADVTAADTDSFANADSFSASEQDPFAAEAADPFAAEAANPVETEE